MSGKSGDLAWVWIVLIVGGIWWWNSSNAKPEDSPKYKAGYGAGIEEGQDQGEESVCDRIKSNKEEIYDYLKGENICN